MALYLVFVFYSIHKTPKLDNPDLLIEKYYTFDKRIRVKSRDGKPKFLNRKLTSITNIQKCIGMKNCIQLPDDRDVSSTNNIYQVKFTYKLISKASNRLVNTENDLSGIAKFIYAKTEGTWYVYAIKLDKKNRKIIYFKLLNFKFIVII